jgi:hypothetical protein
MSCFFPFIQDGSYHIGDNIARLEHPSSGNSNVGRYAHANICIPYFVSPGGVRHFVLSSNKIEFCTSEKPSWAAICIERVKHVCFIIVNF